MIILLFIPFILLNEYVWADRLVFSHNNFNLTDRELEKFMKYEKSYDYMMKYLPKTDTGRRLSVLGFFGYGLSSVAYAALGMLTSVASPLVGTPHDYRENPSYIGYPGPLGAGAPVPAGGGGGGSGGSAAASSSGTSGGSPTTAGRSMPSKKEQEINKYDNDESKKYYYFDSEEEDLMQEGHISESGISGRIVKAKDSVKFSKKKDPVKMMNVYNTFSNSYYDQKNSQMVEGKNVDVSNSADYVHETDTNVETTIGEKNDIRSSSSKSSSVYNAGNTNTDLTLSPAKISPSKSASAAGSSNIDLSENSQPCSTCGH